MTTSVPAQDRWYPSGENLITSIDAANALKDWWNASFDFQRSEEGNENLMEVSALSLMASRGDEGFTEDEILILSQKITELKMSSAISTMISQGAICVSLVEDNPEGPHYEIAFRATE